MVAIDPRNIGGHGLRPFAPLVGAYGPKPRWRGRLHGGAFIAVVPLGSVLVAAARPGMPRLALGIFLATLAGVFAASASYHLFALSPRAVRWLRRLDHSMIFMLIAGTYTPLCLLVLPQDLGIPVLAVVWLAAAAGVFMKVLRLNEHRGASGSWLYGVLGAGGVLILPSLAERLDSDQLALLLIGGAIYGTGAWVLGSRRIDPWPATFGYHEVFHAMTLVAGTCHVLLVTSLVF